MSEKVIIPYRKLTLCATTPMHNARFLAKSVYNVFSAVCRNDILKNDDYISTEIEIVLPLGIKCDLKAYYFRENNQTCHDVNMERGITNLPTGIPIKIQFPILIGMNVQNIFKNQPLGALIFQKEVQFEKFVALKRGEILLKYRKFSETANAPFRAESNSAGYDLSAAYDYIIHPNELKKIYTDIGFEIPENCYGRIAARSGLAFKHQINVYAGVVDSSFRGNVFVLLCNNGPDPLVIKVGDRVAQLIIEKYAKTNLVEAKLTDTVRGADCSGSSGLNELDFLSIL